MLEVPAPSDANYVCMLCTEAGWEAALWICCSFNMFSWLVLPAPTPSSLKANALSSSFRFLAQLRQDGK